MMKSHTGRMLVVGIFGLLAPAVTQAQGPWTVSITPTVNPLAIGGCGPVRLGLIDPATKDWPRNASGNYVSLADFDLSVTGVDHAGVVGEYNGPSIWSACACQGATVGSTATITATYPSPQLAQNRRAAGVAFQATATFTIAKPRSDGDVAACQALKSQAVVATNTIMPSAIGVVPSTGGVTSPATAPTVGGVPSGTLNGTPVGTPTGAHAVIASALTALAPAEVTATVTPAGAVKGSLSGPVKLAAGARGTFQIALTALAPGTFTNTSSSQAQTGPDQITTRVQTDATTTTVVIQSVNLTFDSNEGETSTPTLPGASASPALSSTFTFQTVGTYSVSVRGTVTTQLTAVTARTVTTTITTHDTNTSTVNTTPNAVTQISTNSYQVSVSLPVTVAAQ